MRDQARLVIEDSHYGRDTAVPHLSGNWLRAARAGWVLLVVIALGILIASLPGYARKMSGQLSHATPETITTSIFIFTALSGIASFVSTLLSLGLSFIFFRRRFVEPTAAVLSFFLLIYGVVLAGPLELMSVYWTGDLALAQTLQGLLLVTPMMALFVLFPNGRFVPAWTRWVLYLTIPWNISLFFLPGFGSDAWAQLDSVELGILMVWYAGFLVVGLYAQVYRYRRVSTAQERQQTKWVVFGFSLWLIYGLLSSWPYFYLANLPPDAPLPWWGPASELGWFLSLAIIPVSLAVAISRSRLWDIDLVINRTLVYGALTTAGIGLYLLMVLLAGMIFQQASEMTGLLLTAVLSAVLFRPLRNQFQRSANRIVPVKLIQSPVSSLPTREGETATQAAPVSRFISWLPLVLWTAVMVLATVGLTLLALNWQTAVPQSWGFRGFQSITTIPMATVGVLIARRHPKNPIGWLFLVSSIFSGLAGFGEEYATYAILTQPGSLPGANYAGLASILWLPSMGLLGIHVALLFPNGRLLTPRWRLISWLGALWIVVGVVRFAIQPGPFSEIAFAVNPIGIENLETRLPWLTFPIFPAIGIGFLLMILSAISLTLRYWRADGKVRQQLKWLAFVSIFTPIAGVVGFNESVFADLLVLAFAVSLPVGMGIAILRYQLYDIDFLINRTLVYGALMAFVVGIYALIVGSVGAVLQSQGNWVVALLATGLVAILFQPLRERLQRGVNRLVYGQRDEPFEVVARLGRRLENTLSPELALPTIVETIAQALKLPYVAIAVKNSDVMETAVSYGKPTANLHTYPLTHQGELVGQLLVAQRTPKDEFSEADERLLRSVARQAGTAVHAAQLTADLRRSRQRLVTAREEERRRLRRDLHDDLGPKLASLTLSLDAIGKLMERDPTAAANLLADLKEQAGTAVQDIRRLVYNLRPPALDDLGLAAALGESAASYRHGGLRIIIEAPDSLPPLPAAVEVAAYRIAQEAMTNVVRHAGANVCRVTLMPKQGLLGVTIADDGQGLSDDYLPGIGLRSMRERVAELDGRFSIESRPGGGTTVKATLPLKE